MQFALGSISLKEHILIMTLALRAGLSVYISVTLIIYMIKNNLSSSKCIKKEKNL